MTIETPRGVDKQRVVLRGDSGYWLTGAVTVIFVVFLLSAALQGGLGFAIRALPWALFIIWLLYLVLIRPCVVLVPGTIDVINIFRRYAIDWSAVANMFTKYQLVIEVAGGKRIASWGASKPTARRSQVTTLGRISNARTRPVAPQPHQVVSGVMSAWDQPPETAAAGIVSSWDWFGIFPLLVLAVLCVLELIVSALVG